MPPVLVYLFIATVMQSSMEDFSKSASQTGNGIVALLIRALSRNIETTSILLNAHPFVKRMSSDPEFEELLSSGKLKTPLEVKRRTWMEKGGKSLISAYYLGGHYTGYFNIIHGGIMAALIDQIGAEYCLGASPTSYALTKTLYVDFKKPSPPGEVFIAKVSSPQYPFNEGTRKVWIECEVCFQQGGHRTPVANATALFILCESLPKSPSCADSGLIIDDLLSRERGGDLPEFVVGILMACLAALVIGGLWIIQTWI